MHFNEARWIRNLSFNWLPRWIPKVYGRPSKGDTATVATKSGQETEVKLTGVMWQGYELETDGVLEQIDTDDYPPEDTEKVARISAGEGEQIAFCACVRLS